MTVKKKGKTDIDKDIITKGWGGGIRNDDKRGRSKLPKF